MDEHLFEKIGASITGALLVMWGALKALAKILNPRELPEGDPVRTLGELVDELTAITERAREQDVSGTVTQLLAASGAQAQQINGLEVQVGSLSATVDGIDDRVKLLEDQRR